MYDDADKIDSVRKLVTAPGRAKQICSVFQLMQVFLFLFHLSVIRF